MKRQCCRSSQGHTGPKVRTSPTNTSLLPPCKVCQQQAAGFHYGVNTCEACKGFFRRSMIREEPYRCLGKGSCSIRAGKRKICPQCRYLKCLEVGMSKDNIKTGRYTHAKRTQDTLEYYQTLGQPFFNDSEDTATSRNQTMNTLLDSLLSEVGHSLPEIPSAPEETHQENAETWNILESKPQLSPLSPSSIEQLRSCLEASPGEPSSVQSSQDRSLSDSALSDQENRNGEGLPSMASLCETAGRRNVEVSLSDWWMSENGNPSMLSPSVNNLTDSDSSVYTDADNTVPALPSAECLVEFFRNGDPETEVRSREKDKDPDVLDDVQCEKLVRHLVQAHQKLVISYCDNLTPEMIKKEQKDCYENCKLKRAVFGSMDLSEREYQDIYRKTGLDADNRQVMVSIVMQRVEDNIHRYIHFVKTIPGFLNLCTNDQIRLIRDNRSEYGILCHYWGLNDDLKVATFPCGSTLCIHELSKVWGRDLFLHRFQCARLLQRLGLTKQETIMLKCLMVVTVGKHDVDEPEKVSALQWKMAQGLQWTLRQTRPNPDRVYARIIGAMSQLRYLCQNFYNWLKTNPFQDYSQVQNSSLLAEWFSDFDVS